MSDPIIDILMGEKKKDEQYLDYMIKNFYNMIPSGTDFGNGITADAMMETMKRMRDGKNDIAPGLPKPVDTKK